MVKKMALKAKDTLKKSEKQMQVVSFSPAASALIRKEVGEKGLQKIASYIQEGRKRPPATKAGFLYGISTVTKDAKGNIYCHFTQKAKRYYAEHKDNPTAIAAIAFWKPSKKVRIAKRPGPLAKERAMKAGAVIKKVLAGVLPLKTKSAGELEEAMKGAKKLSVPEPKKTFRPAKAERVGIKMPKRTEEKREYAAKLPKFKEEKIKYAISTGKRTPFELAEKIAIKTSDIKESKDKLKGINEILPSLRRRAVTAMGGEEKMPDIITKKAQKKGAVKNYLVSMRMQRRTENRIKKLNSEVKELRKELRPRKKT
ncbi:hypothetical protein KAW38_04035 [Candidatus Micrarchaeota archaeon]|nr:hypothetical protein [Candidatus Micrarchaeota archaeon]